ncbi:MAG: hypothetical protein Q7T50_04535 [Candidatus Magasanikbacteria bacterium]|nr:hypothetical protein [Candidatus Magasanikbacteria bacterium]
MDRVKKLKIQLSAAIFLFVCLIIFGGFFSSGFKNFALALSANYSKTLPASLSLTEWNYLDDDFVAKSGSVMTGILDMGGQRITGLATPTVTSPANDAANKAYVDAQALAVSGSAAGGIFTNWGRDDCPAGSDFLYGGVAFSANYASVGGSSNIVCMDDLGSAGSSFTLANADKMYPVITGSASLPSSISTDKAVKCAVCRRIGTCYQTFGNNACNTAMGFNSLYSGYLLGAHSNSSVFLNSTERVCVNGTFDNTATPSSTEGAILIGTRIDNNLGLGFSVNSFVRCSVCCN